MRVLITGITGFAGSHLADLLSEKKGVRIFGTHRKKDARGISRIAHIFDCDVRDRAGLRRVLRRTRPDRVFHLAAQASVTRSWQNAAETFEVNVTGTLNLFEELKALGLRPRVHIAGSSQEYGPQEKHRITEDCELRPSSPYAASKIAQEFAAYLYELGAHIPVVRTRAFNHTGPGQREEYVVSTLARQVAEIEAGKRPAVVETGNLDSLRDFTDVRDVVRAYWLALEKGVPGEVYNVCSGVGRRIGDIVGHYQCRSRVNFRVKRATSRLRQHEVPSMLGSAAKLHQRTGWKPEVPFHSTLDSVLDYWRKNAQTTSR